MYIAPPILFLCAGVFLASLIYSFGHPAFVLVSNSFAVRRLNLEPFLLKWGVKLIPMRVKIPAARIVNARDTIAVVNTQLTYVSGKIEGATTDAILRFAKVLQSIEDIERAIQSTGRVMDDIQQKLAVNVVKDASSENAHNDLTLVRQRYENLLKEIVAELSLVVTRKSEDIDRLDAVKESVHSIFAVSDEVATIAREAKFLAINAAIEAANAGEHGKTFAVVADAVAKIANRAQDSSSKMHEQMTKANDLLEANIAQIEEAMDVDSRFINSTIVIIQDVFLSVVDSLFKLSHKIGAIVGDMLGDTSPMKQEVQSLIVNLQFEDMTKQISQHIVQMLEQISEDLTGAMNGKRNGNADSSQDTLLQNFRQVATMESERQIASRLLQGDGQTALLSEDAPADSNDPIVFWDDEPSEPTEDAAPPAEKEEETQPAEELDGDVTFF
ncbi:MAG: methyl-accepting chemotaxis protein [FCB group bacterium]|jgi:hypothetical protein|nr:methyl-accepting chemotaxis protein [FCB group bacterium]